RRPAIIAISTPATRSQWDGETRARPIAAMHGPADATLALIIAALRSPASPLMAILPKAQSWKVLPRASRKGRRMRARQRANGRRPIAIRAHFVRARRPPKFCHPKFRLHRRGMAPEYLSRWRAIGSNAAGKIVTLPRRINQRLRASPLPYRLRSGRTYLITA